MAYANTSRVFPIALSPARVAQALDLRPDIIYREINREGSMLPVHQGPGVTRRILVRDVEAWVSTWAINRKRREVPHV